MSRRFLFLLGGVLAITALLSAQSPESGATPSSAAVQVTNTPSLPEPTPPPFADVAPPPAPVPAGTVLLESQPVAQTNANPAPVSTPAPRKAAGVIFPAPSSQPVDEPLVSIGRPATNYGPEGNYQAARLRSMPEEEFTFDRASLRDVLRFLAESADIPFVSIPETSAQAQQLVTFRMRESPFEALEAVAKQYFIKLTYKDGVWFFTNSDGSSDRLERLERVRKVRDENELVAVMYQLRFDSPDRVDFRDSLQDAAAQQAQNQATQSPPGTVGSPNLPLQNSQKVFAVRTPKLVNDIRAILGLPPLIVDERTGQQRELGQTDSAASGGRVVDYDQLAAAARRDIEGGQAAQLSPGNIPNEAVNNGSSYQGGGNLLQPDSITPLYVPPERPQVIYNADHNTLWVVATRKQHNWVAEYLSKVDKPQSLIAIEVKFLETKKNPQIDIGINWENTFGSGVKLTGGASIGGDNIGRFNYTNGYANRSLSAGQTGAQPEQPGPTNSMPGIGPYSFNQFSNVTTAAQIASGSVPYSAVLSLAEFSVTLQAFMQDRDTSIVQYPRVLTLNNKEVAITAADNTPLNVGTSIASSSDGFQSQTVVGELGYLPTGTQINILPKLVNDKAISMTVAITVSSVVNELPLNLGTGVNLYPVTSERVYNASLQVDSGFTLAVGGLEKVDDSNFEGGIPVLRDLPGLGYLFKNKNKKRNKVNLIIFITPYIIGDPAKTPGISETPQSILPQRPGVPPEPPTFAADGKLVGGEAGIESAFAWLDFQLLYFRQINIEGMMTQETIRKLNDVIGVARALLADLQLQAGAPPYDPEVPSGRSALRAEELLTDLNRALASAQEGIY